MPRTPASHGCCRPIASRSSHGIVAWIAWRWAAAPGQAIAGAAAILLIAPAALGIELAIVSRVGAPRGCPSRRQASSFRRGSPRPCSCFAPSTGASLSAGAWSRTTWRALLRAAPAWCWCTASCATAASGMPGCASCASVGTPASRSTWSRSSAHRRVREPIDEAVERVRRRTGRPPVLVCHSMGGLAARAWWRATQGRRAIARLVTIGTPHRGTWLARFSAAPMGGRCSCAATGSQARAGRSRAALPPTTCWYSNCDNVVFPADTATLPHADNRFVPGVPHVALAFDRECMEATLALIAGEEVPCQGEFLTESTPKYLTALPVVFLSFSLTQGVANGCIGRGRERRRIAPGIRKGPAGGLSLVMDELAHGVLIASAQRPADARQPGRAPRAGARRVLSVHEGQLQATDRRSPRSCVQALAKAETGRRSLIALRSPARHRLSIAIVPCGQRRLRPPAPWPCCFRARRCATR
jgi:hypothetical protein